MNRLIKLVAVGAMALGAGFGPQAAAAQEELRIGTASLGGAFYPMGQALSNSVNRFAEGYTMVPIVTGGGAENPRLVESGEVELAIGQASLSYFAYKGMPPYREPMDIRTIGTLHSSILHMVTLPGSGIETIEDLRGKRVAVGPAGGGTLNLLRDVLEIHGMTMEDLTPSFVSYSDGFSQLTDGFLDASFAVAGYPTGAVIQAQAMNDLSFIELSEEKMEALLEAHPYYSQIDVPAEVYGTEAPLNAIASANMVIVKADMPDELAFTLAEAIYGNMEALIAESALAKKIDPAKSLDLPIPLHPGAAAFFEAKD